METFESLHKPSDTPDKSFTEFVDVFFTRSFNQSPAWATSVGLHEYDDRMADCSAEAHRKEADELKKDLQFVEALTKVEGRELNRLNRMDSALLKDHIRARLLELETIRMWQRDPDGYPSQVTSAVFDLIKRDYAPLEQRMKSVIAREKQIPGMLQDGKRNIITAEVPQIYADVAAEQLPGEIAFFENSLPEALKSVKNEALQAEFKQANEQAIDSLEDYQKFVGDLAKSGNCKGNFALGADSYAKKLRYEEMVDTPLDQVLSQGYDELHRLQAEFRAVGKEIDPDADASQVFETIAKDHPTADKLIGSTRDVLEEIRSYCIDHNIVTIPSQERARVDETPPFMRALTFASMDTPGPYEKNAREAYYFVTLPESNWPAERIEEHLRFYSFPDLINTSVHEAYPGHYVQFLWSKQFPSKVRKLLGCNSNVEGWAHYCEQMMIDEGLRKGDKKLHMVQIHDALLRACRYIVGIQMHTKGMSLADGTQFFMKEGFMEKANAEREAKRGTMDPTYLVYTLGKMQILSLRNEYQQMKGADYSLKGFHDAFLSRGFPPVKIVRAELLNTTFAE